MMKITLYFNRYLISKKKLIFNKIVDNSCEADTIKIFMKCAIFKIKILTKIKWMETFL